MAINVVRFEHLSLSRWGILDGPSIIPVPGDYRTTGDFVRQHPVTDLKALRAARHGLVDASSVRLLSPVTQNQQFICLGANYRQHMVESGLDPDQKSYNMVFTKAPSCIAPADSQVIKPKVVKFLDYEIELGLVLKRDIFGKTVVSADNLHEFVAGMVIVNDYSARDIQIPQTQFYKGKSFRTFGPVGPHLCLLEPAEMRYLKDMTLELRVNGEVRQHDSTRNLVWGAEETLSELSAVHDLCAGDLIATGTPAGCALSVPSPGKQRMAALLPERVKWRMFESIQRKRPYLQIGDLVEARIHSADRAIDLGVQRNRVTGEA